MDATVMARRAVRRMPPGKVQALTGSDNPQLAQELIRQTIQALGLAHGLSRNERRERVAAAEAALAGLRPQETLESMMATQMIATHGAAMACLTRAADEDVDDATAQAALRRAERLLAVYARQSDGLLRARVARRPAGGGSADREGAGRAALPYDAPPWMMLLAPEARAWIEAQIAEARAVGTPTEPARLAAEERQALSYQPSAGSGPAPREDGNGDGV
jgi:hypothetical protein